MVAVKACGTWHMPHAAHTHPHTHSRKCCHTFSIPSGRRTKTFILIEGLEQRFFFGKSRPKKLPKNRKRRQGQEMEKEGQNCLNDKGTGGPMDQLTD